MGRPTSNDRSMMLVMQGGSSSKTSRRAAVAPPDVLRSIIDSSKAAPSRGLHDRGLLRAGACMTQLGRLSLLLRKAASKTRGIGRRDDKQGRPTAECPCTASRVHGTDVIREMHHISIGDICRTLPELKSDDPGRRVKNFPSPKICSNFRGLHDAAGSALASIEEGSKQAKRSKRLRTSR